MSSSLTLQVKLISRPQTELAMNEVDSLHHFSSVKVIPLPEGILLPQTQYIKELLEIPHGKPVARPLNINIFV